MCDENPGVEHMSEAKLTLAESVGVALYALVENNTFIIVDLVALSNWADALHGIFVPLFHMKMCIHVYQKRGHQWCNNDYIDFRPRLLHDKKKKKKKTQTQTNKQTKEQIFSKFT